MYDAFETPRAVRGDLPLLDLPGALDYLEAVRALGFDLAQGYALGRPAPAAALLGALARLPRASLRA